MSGPYRDENETLRAENARLRAELERRHRGRAGWAIVFLALDFFAVVALRPWLNAGSDAKFWGALALVATLAGLAIASAFGGARDLRDPRD